MDEQFAWRVLTESRMVEAKRFVYKYYTTKLPLGKIFRVTSKEIGRRHLEQTEQMIKNGTSYGCFHKVSGKLVAIVQYCVLEKGAPKTKLKENCSPELSALLRFTNWMLNDVFTDLQAQRLLILSCGAVADGFKRHGLLPNINSLTMETAVRHGCEYEVELTTNVCADKVSEEGVFLSMRKTAFCDYVDPETGLKPDLLSLPGYTHAEIMYRKVRPTASHMKSKL